MSPILFVIELREIIKDNDGINDLKAQKSVASDLWASLSKKYIDARGNHIPFGTTKMFAGNIAFASKYSFELKGIVYIISTFYRVNEKRRHNFVVIYATFPIYW